jgi:hypothetical protein
MSEEVVMRALETHQSLNAHFAELGKRYSAFEQDTKTWSTESASGSAAYVWAYLRVECSLSFKSGPNLHFLGQGLVAGLGATGSLGGQAAFNVDPKTLKGASGITFEAAALGIGVGGFQVTWFKNHTYIGHGEFYGAGVQLGTPGGGWGSFT